MVKQPLEQLVKFYLLISAVMSSKTGRKGIQEPSLTVRQELDEYIEASLLPRTNLFSEHALMTAAIFAQWIVKLSNWARCSTTQKMDPYGILYDITPKKWIHVEYCMIYRLCSFLWHRWSQAKLPLLNSLSIQHRLESLILKGTVTIDQRANSMSKFNTRYPPTKRERLNWVINDRSIEMHWISCSFNFNSKSSISLQIGTSWDEMKSCTKRFCLRNLCFFCGWSFMPNAQCEMVPRDISTAVPARWEEATAPL